MTSCRTVLAHTLVSFACLNCSQKVFSYGTVWLKRPAACRVYPVIKHLPAAQYLQLLSWLVHASNICTGMVLGTLPSGDHLFTCDHLWCCVISKSVSVWSALNCLGVVWEVTAEGGKQGLQNNHEPLHGARRSCSPALAEEQEGHASSPACRVEQTCSCAAAKGLCTSPGLDFSCCWRRIC